MNKIIKQIIKIADKENKEIMSISPIFNDMEEMKSLIHIFRALADDYSLKLDSVYITFTEDAENILFPVKNNNVIEELVLKIDPKEIERMLGMYNELEEDEETDEKQIYN